MEVGRSGKTAPSPFPSPPREREGVRGDDTTAEMLKIGIKYCGGCNPGYERVEMIERVQFRFNDRFLFLHHDDPDIEGVILMSGCPRTCASQDVNPTEIPNCSITGENDFNTLITWLKSLDQKGDF
jgi:hypothetical protein